MAADTEGQPTQRGSLGKRELSPPAPGHHPCPQVCGVEGRPHLAPQPRAHPPAHPAPEAGAVGTAFPFLLSGFPRELLGAPEEIPPFRYFLRAPQHGAPAAPHTFPVLGRLLEGAEGGTNHLPLAAPSCQGPILPLDLLRNRPCHGSGGTLPLRGCVSSVSDKVTLGRCAAPSPLSHRGCCSCLPSWSFSNDCGKSSCEEMSQVRIRRIFVTVYIHGVLLSCQAGCFFRCINM